MIPYSNKLLRRVEDVESVEDLGEVLTQHPNDDLKGFVWKLVDANVVGFNNDNDIFYF